MAILAALAARFSGLLAVIGEIATTLFAAFATGFGGLGGVVGKVTWVAMCHLLVSTTLTQHEEPLLRYGVGLLGFVRTIQLARDER